MSSTSHPVPSATRTVLVHVIAIAGLACGALTGAFVARDARALQAQPASSSHENMDGDGDADTCVLPGVLKPGQKACNV